MLGKRIEQLETQMKSLRTKDKIQVVKTSSLDSTSSTATTSNQKDLITPNDINDEDDGQVPDDQRDIDDDELPSELDHLVKEAINELKIKELQENVVANNLKSSEL
jgi:hypothetical protein